MTLQNFNSKVHVQVVAMETTSAVVQTLVAALCVVVDPLDDKAVKQSLANIVDKYVPLTPSRLQTAHDRFQVGSKPLLLEFGRIGLFETSFKSVQTGSPLLSISSRFEFGSKPVQHWFSFMVKSV